MVTSQGNGAECYSQSFTGPLHPCWGAGEAARVEGVSWTRWRSTGVRAT